MVLLWVLSLLDNLLYLGMELKLENMCCTDSTEGLGYNRFQNRHFSDLLKDPKGYTYKVQWGLIQKGQIHIVEMSPRPMLVKFSEENKSESEYYGNQIIGTDNPELNAYGFPCLDEGFTDVVRQNDKVVSKKINVYSRAPHDIPSFRNK